MTGANKGIGLATAQEILAQRDNTRVLLGARDAGRGERARDTLLSGHPQRAGRVEVVGLDVASDESVAAAAAVVRELLGDAPLYGVVNNAGIGLGSSDLDTVLNVNTYGVHRMCEAFLPLLCPGGRIVNVSSASGPRFVSQCTADMRAFFQDGGKQWQDIEQLLAAARDGSATGLGDVNAYGLSKACVTLYTILLARDNPQLCINACTPGYIETDLTRPTAEARGMAPIDLGMKPPVAGTVAIMRLLFDTLDGNGYYYGSDGLRSPLDRYRAPGDPEYTGD